MDGEQDGADLESWRPVALEHIQADTTELIDVWMVYLGKETDLWWCHWVVVWEEELEVEDATLSFISIVHVIHLDSSVARRR